MRRFWFCSHSVCISFPSAQVFTESRYQTIIISFCLITEIQGFQMDLLHLPWRGNKSLSDWKSDRILHLWLNILITIALYVLLLIVLVLQPTYLSNVFKLRATRSFMLSDYGSQLFPFSFPILFFFFFLIHPLGFSLTSNQLDN